MNVQLDYRKIRYWQQTMRADRLAGPSTGLHAASTDPRAAGEKEGHALQTGPCADRAQPVSQPKRRAAVRHLPGTL